MSSANEKAPTQQKKRRSQNDYLKLGVRNIYKSLAAQQAANKKGKGKKGRGKKGEGEEQGKETAFALPSATAQQICKLVAIVVHSIAELAAANTRARNRQTVMPADIVFAISNKFLVLSELVPKEINYAREELCNLMLNSITDVLGKHKDDQNPSARSICTSENLGVRSVYAKGVLKKAAPNLMLSCNAIVALTVFIHFFTRYICFIAMRDQIKDGLSRLTHKHVQQAIRADRCLSPHFSHVRILNGYHYPNVYGKFSTGDRLNVHQH